MRDSAFARARSLLFSHFLVRSRAHLDPVESIGSFTPEQNGRPSSSAETVSCGVGLPHPYHCAEEVKEMTPSKILLVVAISAALLPVVNAKGNNATQRT